jgi:hypothetical protein
MPTQKIKMKIKKFVMVLENGPKKVNLKLLEVTALQKRNIKLL